MSRLFCHDPAPDERRRLIAAQKAITATESIAPVLIARCPEHGLHGERTTCFVCDGPVEQVPMVPAPRADR